MNKFFVFLCVMLLSFGITRIANAETDIDTTLDCASAPAPGDQPLGGFGMSSVHNVETFGQTFTVTDPDTSLYSFTFFLDDTNKSVTSFVEFKAYVMKWDEANKKAVSSHPTDPALFESAGTFEAPGPSGAQCEGVTINIEEGLPLDPGEYVAFFSTTGIFGHVGEARWWVLFPTLDPHSGGSFFKSDDIDSDNDLADLLTDNSWEGESAASDSAFIMSFTPPFIDPTDQLVDLIGDVMALNLQQGISNSLDAKLDSALNALDDVNENNDIAASNSLQTFINAVEAQRGNKISDAEADMLIALAQAIITSLGG